MTDPHAGARLWRSLREEVARAVVGGEEPLRLLTVALLAEGHALIEDVPGVGKTLLARAFARAPGPRLRPGAGHPRPAPVGRHRLERAGRWLLPIHSRTDLHERAAGRRDQPRHAAHPVGTARGDAGAPGQRRWRDAPDSGALPGAGHPEPDRARGDVRAAGGAAGPIPRPHRPGLPGRGRRTRDRAALPRRRRAARGAERGHGARRAAGASATRRAG